MWKYWNQIKKFGLTLWDAGEPLRGTEPSAGEIGEFLDGELEKVVGMGPRLKGENGDLTVEELWNGESGEAIGVRFWKCDMGPALGDLGDEVLWGNILIFILQKKVIDIENAITNKMK